MEELVAWLSELSPLTVYLIVGLSTFLENLFPPTPSDVVVAVAGFLSQRTGVSPVLVWLVAAAANLAGTLLVYWAARRFGRRFVASRFGGRLLPAEAILDLEQGYLRFGVVGIFFSRFLPGFRSVVAPFAGLVNLSPARAFVPIGAATVIWYAVLTWAGGQVGASWEAINGFLAQLNRSLALVAVVVIAALGVWFWRRSKAAGPRRHRLLAVVQRALGEKSAAPMAVPGGDLAAQGAAALLHELTHEDPGFSLEERSAIAEFLRVQWGLGEAPHRTSTGGRTVRDTAELATIVTEGYELPDRIALAERLYRIAASDGTLSRHEERLMRRAGDLLCLTAADLAEARQRAFS